MLKRCQAALDAADVTCGLSLGEYTALTFAGAVRLDFLRALQHPCRSEDGSKHPVISARTVPIRCLHIVSLTSGPHGKFVCTRSFEDGLRLVKLRGESMQVAADKQPSAMASVLKLDADKVMLSASTHTHCIPPAQSTHILVRRDG